MKVKLSILALALCGLFTFTSCDDDDNNYLPDQTVTKAFDEKYPGVGKVEWETKSGYEVADFHLSGNNDKDGNQFRSASRTGTLKPERRRIQKLETH